MTCGDNMVRILSWAPQLKTGQLSRQRRFQFQGFCHCFGVAGGTLCVPCIPGRAGSRIVPEDHRHERSEQPGLMSSSSVHAALRTSWPMLSAAKLAANRRNALRSSGPRTIAGTRASSMNATRHGLSATSVVVIRGVEDEAEYEALVADVIADLKPIGAVERLLAERVAQLWWRLRRVLRFETERLSQENREATSSGATLEEMVRNGAC
jgi:hypothetical protein